MNEPKNPLFFISAKCTQEEIIGLSQETLSLLETLAEKLEHEVREDG